jgi:GNAT superfamily N-acetyltransferase
MSISAATRCRRRVECVPAMDGLMAGHLAAANGKRIVACPMNLHDFLDTIHLSFRRRSTPVAQADIIIADEGMLAQAVELHNTIFRPKREVEFFKRRFTGRYNPLTLLARMGDRPVGFWIGFELKPGMFYHWLGGVAGDVRRHGVGRQLQEAQQAWARDHGYEFIRCECMNHQREFVHFAITVGYDIVGIRWDSTHADNLIVFEKNLVE